MTGSMIDIIYEQSNSSCVLLVYADDLLTYSHKIMTGAMIDIIYEQSNSSCILLIYVDDLLTYSPKNITGAMIDIIYEKSNSPFMLAVNVGELSYILLLKCLYLLICLLRSLVESVVVGKGRQLIRDSVLIIHHRARFKL